MARNNLCQFCNHQHEDPDYMHPTEFKLIRGILGARLGLNKPLPIRSLAVILRKDARSITYYERGVRAGRTYEVPPLVAREMRRLKASKFASLTDRQRMRIIKAHKLRKSRGPRIKRTASHTDS